jgi:tetratricopeptide (TPR) repeat protein
VIKTQTDDLIEAAEAEDPNAVLREADERVRGAGEAGPELWGALFARGQALAALGLHRAAISDYTAAAAGFGLRLEEYAVNLSVALFQRARSLEAMLCWVEAAGDDAAALALHPEAFTWCARQQRGGRPN